MEPGALGRYARLCGMDARPRPRPLRRPPIAIGGYLGTGDAFDRAIADFAEAYADQNERDHAALLAAIDSGRLDGADRRLTPARHVVCAAMDFAAEGLLDGLEDGRARAERIALLEELSADGVSLAELKAAVAEDRLVFLRVERTLGDRALHARARSPS